MPELDFLGSFSNGRASATAVGGRAWTSGAFPPNTDSAEHAAASLLKEIILLIVENNSQSDRANRVYGCSDRRHASKRARVVQPKSSRVEPVYAAHKATVVVNPFEIDKQHPGLHREYEQTCTVPETRAADERASER